MTAVTIINQEQLLADPVFMRFLVDCYEQEAKAAARKKGSRK